MIKTFKHKGLEKFFHQGTTRGMRSKHAERLSNILDLLDAADRIEVMNFPGSRLHKLEPKKEDIWSVRISGNWRVTFKYENGDAYAVDYLDYR